MSTTFIATLIVKKGREAEFERLQQELSEITHRDEPDTHVYDVIRHRTKPQTYIVYARFKDEAAFELHQKMPAHDRLVPPILDCLAEPMDLAFYDWKS
jgi:quinol monooxygenase YgiN